MSEWKDAFIELPKKIGYYLTERFFEDGNENFYSVERFESQEEYKKLWSNEFNQNVDVVIKTSDPKFKEASDNFVVFWMEIPE